MHLKEEKLHSCVSWEVKVQDWNNLEIKEISKYANSEGTLGRWRGLVGWFHWILLLFFVFVLFWKKMRNHWEAEIICIIWCLRILSKVARRLDSKMESPDCSFSWISVTILLLKSQVCNSHFFYFPPDILQTLLWESADMQCSFCISMSSITWLFLNLLSDK